MNRLIACPHCGLQFLSDTTQAGMLVQCASCAQFFQLPLLTTPATDELLPSPPAFKLKKRRGLDPLVVGLLLVLLVAVVAGVTWLSIGSGSAPASEQSEIFKLGYDHGYFFAKHARIKDRHGLEKAVYDDTYRGDVMIRTPDGEIPAKMSPEYRKGFRAGYAEAWEAEK